jgi:hypothetical protein
VTSRQPGLDPVGATVGQRGARVQAVVAELGGEKIDVIEWSEDPSSFVAKALSPAQVIEVRIDEEHRIANVVVPERMLSLAIGREGQNARLAAKLTGWRIDIRSDVSVAEAAAEAVRVEAEAEPAETSKEAEVEATPADANVAAIEGTTEAVVVPVAAEVADAPAKPKRAKAVKSSEAAAPVAADIADTPAKPKRTKAAKSSEAVGDVEVSS